MLADNPLFTILLVVVAIYIFLKFCGWAKGFQLSGQLRKWVFILTGLGMVVFNYLYAKGNALIHATGDWSGATIALLASLIWVFIFAFALMAETKPNE
ncbi:Uncharacterized [Syntrophomonas zehnderi OL-4]|uniref:Uncharacterized n=1 Tax=Syntrophomonas zehnderi OL-4 TaxID=690567 RepID=A0A0E4C9P1_9FIRM|nr:hypothetical protein [Syntrophomonas zehnderi]CFY06011.1 Uncharacterized [Syntrophomonas zehnderi OL-4]